MTVHDESLSVSPLLNTDTKYICYILSSLSHTRLFPQASRKMIIPEEEIRTSPPCDVALMAYTSSNSQDSTVTTDCATYVLLRVSRKIQDTNLEKCAFANRKKPKARADDVVTIMFKTKCWWR